MMPRFRFCNLVYFCLALMICLVGKAPFAYAESDSICGSASTTNPNTVDGGIGGTGVPAHGGIGGTGVTNQHGGIGGTGAPITQNTLLPENTRGAIAIMGVVTGFASICVNDVEVHYDANTPVLDNGKSSMLSGLAVGRMVMLRADRVEGRLQARAIGMFDAVAGPIDRIDVARQRVQVMGQTVQLDANTAKQLNNTAVGESVRVSGHRLATGQVVATRVDVVSNEPRASTLGVVTDVKADSIVINGTHVNLSNLSLDRKQIENIQLGSEIQVSGHWDGRALKADRVEIQPISHEVNRAETAIVEGFARSNRAGLMLSGTEVQVSRGKLDAQSDSAEKVVKIEMRRDNNGAWVSDKVEERKGELFDRALEVKGHGSNKEGVKNDQDKKQSGGRRDARESDSKNSSSSDGSSGSSGGRGSSGDRGDSKVSGDERSGGGVNRDSSSSLDRASSSGSGRSRDFDRVERIDRSDHRSSDGSGGGSSHGGRD